LSGLRSYDIQLGFHKTPLPQQVNGQGAADHNQDQQQGGDQLLQMIILGLQLTQFGL
jgi:hypothetical protein